MPADEINLGPYEHLLYAMFSCTCGHTVTVVDPSGDLECSRCGAIMDVSEAGVVAFAGTDQPHPTAMEDVT